MWPFFKNYVKQYTLIVLSFVNVFPEKEVISGMLPETTVRTVDLPFCVLNHVNIS